MKKICLLSITIFLFCHSIYCQWAPIGAKWYYSHTYGAPQYLTIIESVRDTLILNKQCKVLKSYNIYVQGLSPGIYQWDTLYCPLQYTYCDSSKVYLYDNLLNDFYALYNFNATAGDTITVKDTLFSGYCPDNFSCSIFQYKVDSVSDTILNGISLRKQYASATPNADWIFYNPPYPGAFNHYPLIEKIGSLRYLFGTGISGVEGSISHLRCYQDSSISYHSPDWPDSLACDYLYTLITDIKKTIDTQNKITIFPNPTSGQINIETNFDNPFYYYIYNIFGHLEMTGVSNAKLTLISISSLCNGIYSIIVNSDGKILRDEFIVLR